MLFQQGRSCRSWRTLKFNAGNLPDVCKTPNVNLGKSTFNL